MNKREPISIDDAILLIAKYGAEVEELEGKRHARPEDAKATKKQWHASLQGHIRVRKAEILRLQAWMRVEQRKEQTSRQTARTKELQEALRDAYSILVRLSGVAQLSYREQDVMFRVKQVLEAHPRVPSTPEPIEETR